MAAGAYFAYRERIAQATNVPELLGLLDQCEPSMVVEAKEVAAALTEEGFAEWSFGLTAERAGVENSDEWLDKYLNLLVPPAYARLFVLEEDNQTNEDTHKI